MKEKGGGKAAADFTHSLVVKEVSLQCLAGHVLLPVFPLLVFATVVVPSVRVPLLQTHPTEVWEGGRGGGEEEGRRGAGGGGQLECIWYCILYYTHIAHDQPAYHGYIWSSAGVRGKT